jgi:hypothetical protein
LQLLALLAQILHGGFACPHQITYDFVPGSGTQIVVNSPAR